MSDRSDPESLDDRLAQIERQLFLIIGSGRSGTTLLQSMLVSDRSIAIPPETHFYDVVRRRKWEYGNLRNERNYRRVIHKVWRDQGRWGVHVDERRLEAYALAAPRTIDGLFLSILAAYADQEGAQRVGEKSPRHMLSIAHLIEALPNARFIHMMRDPRAVIQSQMSRINATNRIARHIELWRKAAQMHRQYADRLEPTRYLLVRYERLVTDPAAVIQEVCRFIGAPMTETMLEPHKRQRKVQSDDDLPWFANTKKPIFTTSVDKWRDQMKPSDVALVEYALSDEMKRLGYEPTGATTWWPAPRLTASLAVEWVERQVEIVPRAWRRARRALAGRADAPPQSGSNEQNGRDGRV